MGQSGSKKSSPKRASVHSLPAQTIRTTSVFDHVIDQIVESSGMSHSVPLRSRYHFKDVALFSAQYAPVADPPDQQYANKVHVRAFVDTLFSLPNEVDGEHHLQKLGNHWFHEAQAPASGGEWLDRNALLKAIERHHGIIDDQVALSTYLYLYADSSGKHLMTAEDVQAFLELSMFMYLLDSWNSDEATDGDQGHAQVQGVLNALFNDVEGREAKEGRMVLKYFEANLPNCVQHIHKFVLFRLLRGPVIGGVFTNRVVLDAGSTDPTSFRQSLDKYKMWQISAILPAIPYFKSPVEKTQQQQSGSAPSSRRPSYYLSSPMGKGKRRSLLISL